MRPKLVRGFLVVLLAAGASMLAQTTGTPPVPSASTLKPQFFAGTVTDLTVQQITVSRTPVGRPLEKRTFVITPRTKLTKALKVKSRVTVRYQHLHESDVALEVELQPRLRPPRPS